MPTSSASAPLSAHGRPALFRAARGRGEPAAASTVATVEGPSSRHPGELSCQIVSLAAPLFVRILVLAAVSSVVPYSQSQPSSVLAKSFAAKSFALRRADASERVAAAHERHAVVKQFHARMIVVDLCGWLACNEASTATPLGAVQPAATCAGVWGTVSSLAAREGYCLLLHPNSSGLATA